jgi:hypothetical protein
MPGTTPGSDNLPPATRGAALAAALVALERLADLGESIEDEWTYVTALAEAGRSRLRAAAGIDTAAPLAPRLGAAVTAACAETARIVDPHRAIDWLSTFPAVVGLALDTPDGPARAAPAAPGAPAPGAPGAGPAAGRTAS